MTFKPKQSIEICLALICCVFLYGSTVEAQCSPDQSIACLRDATRVLMDFVNNPSAYKIKGLCDSQRQSWACLNSHNCDVSGAEPGYRRAMELCNGNVRDSGASANCAEGPGMACVRNAANVLNDFMKNPQYNYASMRRLCNSQRDMKTCLVANRCYTDGLEEAYRRTMQQCNAYFRGGYTDGASGISNRTKRAAEFGESIVQPFFESATGALLSFRSEE